MNKEENAAPHADFRRARMLFAGALLYVALVHGADTLAARGVVAGGVDWTGLRWRLANGVDLFKLTAWLSLPVAVCLRGMDRGAFGFRRWRRADAAVLAGLVVAGLGGIAIAHAVPSLQAVYRGWGEFPPEVRARLALYNLFWTFSWLTGWEFIHRYALLRAADAAFPRWGWLTVPLVETLYHLQKPSLEALGMGIFGLILTAWARRRRNIALPFLAHLAVELELIAYLCLF